MEASIDFVFGHLAELFCITLGIGLILYSCLARRISFEGDVAVRPEERKLHEVTPKMRIYGFALGMLPLLYGLYQLLYPLATKGSGGRVPH
jgi:hypothetical protein